MNRDTIPYRDDPTMAFMASRLDRREQLLLVAAREGPGDTSRFLLLDAKGRVLTQEADGVVTIVRFSREEAHACLPGEAIEVFLGRDDKGRDHWARRAIDDVVKARTGTANGRRIWRDARAFALALWPGSGGRPVDHDSGDLALALALTNWHLAHRFCARCAQPSTPARAGWIRRCRACGTEHFPRTDPVVIMLPIQDHRILLARQPHFPPGMFSALAGFVSPGETLEAAVAREIAEETGLVLAGRPRYVASQAWPFPSSLMIGFFAPVAAGPVRIDGAELEAARWFSCAEAARALEGGDKQAFAPPPMAIAHHLIRRWLVEEGRKA
ncbi:MAG: NAD(+) diphosphatase [Alphaproteobacteria bacterium]|nr:MAG: NAD(+) diphosphatase [Alphaproteobacteria bacterium]